jgi:hypothetical protein
MQDIPRFIKTSALQSVFDGFICFGFARTAEDHLRKVLTDGSWLQ